MGFLHYLDVMIGYVLGMAVLAALIGSASGAWVALIRTRTRHMRTGLASLIQCMGDLTETESKALADGLLMDRMVKPRVIWDWLNDPTDWRSKAGAIVRFVRGFAAETIAREELALIVLRKASEGNVGALKALGLDATAFRHPELLKLTSRVTEVRASLRGLAPESLAQRELLTNELQQLSAAIEPLEDKAHEELLSLKSRATVLLRSVEKAILEEEVKNPELPAQTWRTRALASQVPTMASQVFGQFDNLMDRVEDNVGFSSKAAAAVFAGIFLCWYPVSSVDILNRLSTNDKLREQSVESARAVQPAAGTANQNAVPKGEATSDQATNEDSRKAALNKAGDDLASAGLFGTVLNAPKAFDARNLFGDPGVLLTWVMVSMGAPFWLNQLTKLLGLRTEMARNLSEQKSIRDRDLRA